MFPERIVAEFYLGVFAKYGSFLALTYIEFADHDRLKILIAEVEKALTSYKSTFKNQAVYFSHLTLLRMHFILGNYRQALRKINFILGDKKIAIQSRTFIELRTYEYCIHYISGNDDIMYAIHRAVEKMLNKEESSEIQQVMYTFIKNLSAVEPGRMMTFFNRQKEEFGKNSTRILPIQDEGFYVTMKRWLEEQTSRTS